ncbi:hypothetical protein [Methanobrevibacter sp.]|uniref:hypothetical protein n=1 Tax=Methanobrevibacter sp. TaxID=66852 RepID=UPI00388F2A75
MDNQKLNVKPGDEIVIVIPEDADEDELVIDLDELGIDVENLGEDVNIVIQLEGEAEDGEFIEGVFDEDGNPLEANEWYFDDDPYKIVYYEYPDWDEEE